MTIDNLTKSTQNVNAISDGGVCGERKGERAPALRMGESRLLFHSKCPV